MSLQFKSRLWIKHRGTASSNNFKCLELAALLRNHSYSISSFLIWPSASNLIVVVTKKNPAFIQIERHLRISGFSVSERKTFYNTDENARRHRNTTKKTSGSKPVYQSPGTGTSNRHAASLSTYLWMFTHARVGGWYMKPIVSTTWGKRESE